jgi:outer membrane protein assembly factor BamA
MRERLRTCVVRPLVIAIGLALGAALPSRVHAQEIDCGPSDREVQALKFEGNTTFKSDVLSARVLTTVTSFYRRVFRIFGTRRCLPDVGLNPDVMALKQFYQDNGFFKTQVDTVVKLLGSRRAAVTFRIVEGPPMVLDSLVVTGLDSVAGRQPVLEQMRLVPGERVGTVRLVADVDSLTSWLRNSGYPAAEVFRTFRTSSDRLQPAQPL